MQLIANEKIIDIMEQTLNHVDARLINHGKRVAYLIYKVLKQQSGFDAKQLHDICILSMLHDVGAYKTEEIDKMVIFETRDVWDHSIYGYLFLNYFSPLKNLAPAILFHHAECDAIEYLEDPAHKVLAQLISLCDRADVFSLHGGGDAAFRAYMDKYRDIKYRGDIVDMFHAANINIDNIFGSIDSDKPFNDIFRGMPLTEDEVGGYIKMIIYSIDFRSSQTVIHTVSAACIAGILASMTGADENDIIKVRTGAMLHDIGKVGIPLHILESTGKLSDSDMKVMMTHVDFTEKILDGNVNDDIKRIAVRHHEKLNGTGYPKHLDFNDITCFERIVSIADIFSALCGTRSYKGAYPKEKVIGILSDMSGKNLIDSHIVSLAIDNFDTIIELLETEVKPIIDIYYAMDRENLQMRDKIRNADYALI